MQFVDTNAFLRLVTGLPIDQAERMRAFFNELEQSPEWATTSESVISEVVFVLGSKRNYGLPRNDIAEAVRAVLSIRGLIVSQAPAIWEAVRLFETTSVPWVDCLCIAQMREAGLSEIVSFDRHFDQFDGIVRVEP